jgi:hypothetical protein
VLVADLHCSRDTEEMDKTDILITDDLYLIDRPKALKLVPEVLLRRRAGEITDKHIPRGLRVRYSVADRCGQLASFAPSDLQLLAVESKLLDLRVCVERGRSRAVEERDENAGSLGQESHALDRAEADQVEKFVYRSV